MMDYFAVKYAGIKFAGALVIIAMQPITFFGSNPAKAQGLEEDRLQHLQNQFHGGCFVVQREAAMNKGVKDDVIKSYCQCYSKTIINNSITQHDLDEIRKLHQANASPEKTLSVLLKGRDADKIASDCIDQVHK